MELMKEAKELTGIAPVEEIRAQFPALARRHKGYPVAYFDGPGGTQVPRQVAEAMIAYLYHHNANTHWAYPTSAETDALIAAARAALADFFNASSAEIAFGAPTRVVLRQLAHDDPSHLRLSRLRVAVGMDPRRKAQPSAWVCLARATHSAWRLWVQAQGAALRPW